MEGIHVSIAAQKLTEIFGVPVTNSLLMSWITVLTIVLLVTLMTRRLSLVPGKLQSVFEILVSEFGKFVEETLESASLARRFTPFLIALFLFILVGNWLEFVPGVESIHVHTASEHGGEAHTVPLLRSMNTDLNTTLALALIAFFTIEITGVAVIGFWKYASKFLNFHSFIGFFVGILELLSEVIRLISFSFRLFGNIFAGSVLLMIITFLVPYIVPVPFMLFEVFVGLIQAAVFTLLTLFFIKLAIMEPEHG